MEKANKKKEDMKEKVDQLKSDVGLRFEGGVCAFLTLVTRSLHGHKAD